MQEDRWLWLILGDLVIIIPNERLQESKQQILVPALYLDIDIDNPIAFSLYLYNNTRVRRTTTDDRRPCVTLSKGSSTGSQQSTGSS